MGERSVSVKFEDPPERHSRRQLRWWPLLEQVMTKPGGWARIATLGNAYQANNAVRALRQRKVKYPAGAFAFQADGPRVYARYDGEDS
jgi:hypothetical protein